MPHAELRFSTDLNVDADVILRGIEAILQKRDDTSGDCKGRAFRADVSLHPCMYVHVSLLPKAHRDAAFMTSLRAELYEFIAAHLPRPCWLSMDVEFSGADYRTEWLT